MEQTPSQIEQAEAALRESISCATAWDASCEQAAAHLAGVMAQSGFQRWEMIKRLRLQGLSRRGAARLAADASRLVRYREKARQEQEFAGAVPLCPHCLQPMNPLDHFCPKCCKPVSAQASIDPLGQVYSTGWAYQGAMSGKPRGVVLAGMWLIFGPSLLFLLFMLYLNLQVLGVFPQGQWGYVASDGLAWDLLKLAIILALAVLDSAILWKVTARWVRSRHVAS